MTFDEKLDRLRERHEALTESAQLLLSSALAHGEALTRLENQAEKHDARLLRVEDRMDRLARIVEIHVRRITGLEGGEQ